MDARWQGGFLLLPGESNLGAAELFASNSPVLLIVFKISLFEVVFSFLMQFFELASIIVRILSVRIIVVSRCLLVSSC